MSKNNGTQSTSTESLLTTFRKKLPISGVTTILTHPSPHLDEVGGIYLLQHTPEGQEKFPGIENAGVGFVSTTYLRENGFLGTNGFIKALEAGYLLIGLGDGPFDEHSNRENKVSCIELIKRHLDLFKEKANRSLYGSIIHFINHEDNNGDNLMRSLNTANPERRLTKEESELCQTLNLGQIAQNLKKGFEVAETPKEQEQVFLMGMQFLRNEIEQRKNFLKVSEEYQESIKIQFDINQEGFGLVVKHDSPIISKVVFQKSNSVVGKKLGVVVIEKNNGQFCIIPAPAFKESMRDVIKILRQKVSRSKTGNGVSFDDLEKTGWIWSVPELYIDENMFIIMNGSKTDPDVPGLIGKHLQISDLVEAIKTATQKLFDSRNVLQCKSGNCVKKLGKPCSFFQYNLTHCKDMMNRTVIGEAFKKAQVS